MSWLSKLIGIDYYEDEIEDNSENSYEKTGNNIVISQPMSPIKSVTEPYDIWKWRLEERPQRGVIEVFVAANISEVRHCADSIKAGKSIIINYREIPLEEGRKFYTFMKGCIQALDWQCIRISHNIFLYTTDKIDIRKSMSSMPNLSDTLQHSWDKPLDKQ